VRVIGKLRAKLSAILGCRTSAKSWPSILRYQETVVPVIDQVEGEWGQCKQHDITFEACRPVWHQCRKKMAKAVSLRVAEGRLLAVVIFVVIVWTSRTPHHHRAPQAPALAFEDILVFLDPYLPLPAGVE
jgi:hypothetical protein